MGKLKFNEIKRDIANGYEYMEYEQTYYGYSVTAILDLKENKVCYFTEGRVGCMEIRVPDFIELRYDQVVSLYHQFLYYSPFYKEELS
jgi:hypothetical protein